MTMYLQHFGLREPPFRITPHTEFFFSGANRGATLEALLYAITAGEGLVKVTGEVGSGKTMLCRVLMERLPETVETLYLAVPSLSRDEMLAAIGDELGIETTGANTTKLIRLLQEKLIAIHAEGKQVVALIDEAHAMPLATLEEVRLLSNLETGTEKLLQLVLFGQPELDQHLALPNMRQLKERITHAFTLAPLPPREIRDYVSFRMRAAGYHGPDLFDDEVLGIIADASEGLTRRINIYSDKALLAAFAAGTHTVTADHARAAVSDTQIVVTRRDSSRKLASVAAAGIVGGIVLGFTAAQFVRAPAGAPQAIAATTPARSEQAAPIPAGNVAAVAQPVAAVTAAPAQSRPAVAPIVPERTFDARLAAGRDLLAGDGRLYSVQLMLADARQRDYIAGYLADAAHAVSVDKLYLVPAGSPESPRLGVLFGAFQDRADASLALAALPENLKQFRPYVRPVEGVREDAQRAERR